jgi:hypothetical protein
MSVTAITESRDIVSRLEKWKYAPLASANAMELEPQMAADIDEAIKLIEQLRGVVA